MWAIWERRNQWCFEGRRITETLVWGRAASLSLEAIRAEQLVAGSRERKNDLYVEGRGLQHKGSSRVVWNWTSPPSSWVKLNMDGSCLFSSNKATTCGFLRDNNGALCFGLASKLGPGDVFLVEIIIMKKGLQFCWKWGFRKVICKSDCLGVVDIMNTAGKGLVPVLEYNVEVTVVMQLCHLDYEVSLYHIRCCNVVRDKLTNLDHAQQHVHLS
ncbi:uncharacterized protein LOC130736905 [Lotus japonicus]|uniref:uncharacterized protein LOC130736905 n=1 Tax=Lotus japonicus TaxID=34305 RepID=UPI002582FF7D|nr:uncharacterized protein LOC130736905 [Lotus japonicus]